MKHLIRALVAVAVLAGACSDGPIKPEPSVRAQMTSAEAADLTPLARYKNMPDNLLMAFAAKNIGPSGGSLRLFDFEIVVPPGAVSKPTRFTIRLPADPSLAERVFAEFSPHGQRFAVPITLRLPLNGTTSEGGSPRVLWFDGNQWVPYTTSLTSDGRIETKTNHFSEYGTEQTENGKGIIAAGKSR